MTSSVGNRTCSARDLRTKAHQVQQELFRLGFQHHVDEPEGVENLNGHPGERAEQGVVQGCSIRLAELFCVQVGHHAREEEEEGE